MNLDGKDKVEGESGKTPLIVAFRGLAFAAGVILISFSVFAFIPFIYALVMCFIGPSSQGHKDSGWDLMALLTGVVCFVGGTIGRVLFNWGRKE